MTGGFSFGPLASFRHKSPLAFFNCTLAHDRILIALRKRPEFHNQRGLGQRLTPRIVTVHRYGTGYQSRGRIKSRRLIRASDGRPIIK